MRWTIDYATGTGLDARQPKNDAVLKGIKEAASRVPTGWEPYPKAGPCVILESTTGSCEAVGRKDTQSVSHVQSLGGGHTLLEEGQVICSDRRIQDAHLSSYYQELKSVNYHVFFFAI